MYKVTNLETNEEVVILDPRWRDKITQLRHFDQQDVLVCPGCQQPVRVRAGQVRRWHFAHKHLENCPFAHQSPGLLKARAVLYEWLVQKYGSEKVTIEKNLPDLPRPLDAWMQAGATGFAYWIFDTRLAPDIRSLLRNSLEGKGIHVNWIFTMNLLRTDEFFPDRLHLTTTEREFLRTSKLDAAAEAAGEAPGQSIHYLDYEQMRLITFRRMHLQHPPQRYAGRRLESSLQEIILLPETGEFIHPVEKGRLQRYMKEADAAQRRLARQEQFMRSLTKTQDRTSNQPEKFENQLEAPPSGEEATPMAKQSTFHLLHEQQEAQLRQPFAREGVCRICGIRTTDWITFFGKTGECICRNCAEQ